MAGVISVSSSRPTCAMPSRLSNGWRHWPASAVTASGCGWPRGLIGTPRPPEPAFTHTPPGIEHQVLHCTAEGLSRALPQVGGVTRDYVPVGHLVPGIAYLVRGILENASQAGFLAQSRKRLSAEAIATDPARCLSELVAQGAYAWDQAARPIDEDSWPSPMVRLYLPAGRQAFADALALTAVYPPARVTPADVPDAARQARQGAEAWVA